MTTPLWGKELASCSAENLLIAFSCCIQAQSELMVEPREAKTILERVFYLESDGNGAAGSSRRPKGGRSVRRRCEQVHLDVGSAQDQMREADGISFDQPRINMYCNCTIPCIVKSRKETSNSSIPIGNIITTWAATETVRRQLI